MKKLFLLCALVVLYSCKAQQPQLVWSDEFNGKELDLTSWNFELGDGCPNLCGWGNNERQIYTKDNHRLEDGKLIITAKKDGDQYTSTRITTQGKHEFQYGRMEARAKLAIGQGIWPAFWMLGSDIKQVGWPASGEIDILEYVGREEDMVYTTLHVPAGHGDSAFSKKTKFEAIEDGYHVYAAAWSPEHIEFFVDDQSVFIYSPEDKNKAVWPFDQPFYFIINMAIGGNFGGPEVDDRIFPQEFSIDYVRVYKL
ncbi:family 16 glycosylhydrolase [Leeuwenhoekiella polynyae]|uniref:Glycosyl hydrolase family 16 n=1 Tax=Leeuwenhoekiella polynyae TaxID=1550906 RepID=A0A4Q0PJR7_9FLAO|nr:glycoside hydrolase family 16 protein [Leeuwenhoekiella polynyae]RXG26611.1 glycosyl hydrolase family 16 [Leeuwenhoekiella polynyae]